MHVLYRWYIGPIGVTLKSIRFPKDIWRSSATLPWFPQNKVLSRSLLESRTDGCNTCPSDVQVDLWLVPAFTLQKEERLMPKWAAKVFGMHRSTIKMHSLRLAGRAMDCGIVMYHVNQLFEIHLWNPNGWSMFKLSEFLLIYIYIHPISSDQIPRATHQCMQIPNQYLTRGVPIFRLTVGAVPPPQRVTNISSRNAYPEAVLRSIKLLLFDPLGGVWSRISNRTARYCALFIWRVRFPTPAKNSNHSRSCTVVWSHWL